MSVEAFQIIYTNKVNTDNWPKWLQEAWNKDSTRVGALYPNHYPSKGIDKLFLNTKGGVYIISSGDYIIKTPEGELRYGKQGLFESIQEILK